MRKLCTRYLVRAARFPTQHNKNTTLRKSFGWHVPQCATHLSEPYTFLLVQPRQEIKIWLQHKFAGCCKMVVLKRTLQVRRNMHSTADTHGETLQEESDDSCLHRQLDSDSTSQRQQTTASPNRTIRQSRRDASSPVAELFAYTSNASTDKQKGRMFCHQLLIFQTLRHCSQLLTHHTLLESPAGQNFHERNFGERVQNGLLSVSK